MIRQVAPSLLRSLAALTAALAATVAILYAAGAPPLTALGVLLQGSLASGAGWLQTLSAFVPLLLGGAAVTVTFAAGLWNIGVEGQITLGAIGALWLLRLADPAGAVPPVVALAAALAAAMAAGAFWALLSGALRVYGRVHEIFSGLGLNFVAMGVVLWLILGPWRRAGMASLSGTEPLPDALRLPALGGRPMSLVGLLIAVAAYAAVAWLLHRTFFGLTLTAVRQNRQAAALHGLAPGRRELLAMAVGGALAGLAGGLLVAGLYHRLIPSISGGFGYTALLAVLMVSRRLALLPLACLFFAALAVGALQLPLQLALDSSLAGVIQGVAVLAVFAAGRLWSAPNRGGR